MSDAILIETPFASAAQTAKILGVSKSRKEQLVKMLKFSKVGSRRRILLPTTDSSKNEKGAKRAGWLVSAKSGGRSGAMKVKRRQSNKRHASKKTRSSGSGDASH